MQRSVEFYKVIYNFYPIDTYLFTDNQLKDYFISEILNTLRNTNPITIIDKGEITNVIIEILEYNNSYLFGIIGKLEDLEGGLLRRLRSKDDLKEIDDETKIPKVYLEYFTYFYLRFSDMQCAVLSNRNAPRFRTHFVNYLKEVTKGLNHTGKFSGLKNLDVVCVYDDQIKYKLKRTKKLSEINMIFEDTSNIGKTLLDLSAAFYISNSDLRKAKISINLNMREFSQQTREIFENEDLIKSNFSKLEVIGEDENSNQIQMELVEKLLTKKIIIEIDEEYLKTREDLEKIKDALAESFAS